jgi:hypothetical protein
MVGNGEWRLIAGVKISSESTLLHLRPGWRNTVSDRQFCVSQVVSEQFIAFFSSPTRAFNMPAGTVLVEGGFLKSRGMGARFSFVTATIGMYCSSVSFSSESLLGKSSFFKFHFCWFLDMTHRVRVAWEARESEGVQWATTHV